MNTPVLSGIKACIFDAYSTLFDVSSVARAAKDALGPKWIDFSHMWRMKQLQYAWMRSLTGNYADFWQVTGDALDYTIASMDFEDDELRDRLMGLYLEILAYKEVPDTLKQLKQNGCKMIILSNATPKMLDSAIKFNQLGGYFSAVISAEEAKKYKPHPDFYQLGADRLGLPKEQICFITSNGWDAYSAKAFGFTTLWCNRFDQRPEHLPESPDGVIENLSQLPACLYPKK